MPSTSHAAINIPTIQNVFKTPSTTTPIHQSINPSKQPNTSKCLTSNHPLSSPSLTALPVQFNLPLELSLATPLTRFVLRQIPSTPVLTNSRQQKVGEAKQDKAAVEKDLSHATIKAPGISASSSGAITKDDPNRQEGAWNQTIGSAKETLGNVVGSEVCIPCLYEVDCIN